MNDSTTTPEEMFARVMGLDSPRSPLRQRSRGTINDDT